MIRFFAVFCVVVFSSSAVFADAGHHGGKSGAGHWMAPNDAAKLVNPVAKDADSIKRGRTLYLENCASCHGKEARGDGRLGKKLRPKPANLKMMAGSHPDGNFAWKIMNGRGPMPAWQDILSTQEIWDLVNYIQSLADGASKHGKGMNHHK